LPEAITQALGTEIDSVADVLEREKEIIANAEASKKDAEQEAVDATEDELAAIQKKIQEYDDEIATASQVIEEAEAMKSSAEAHISALAEAEEQKANLKDAVSHQVNVSTSNFTAELAKLLHRADRDPLTACLKKVNELDQQFAKMLDAGVNGTVPPNGTSFHIAVMIDPSHIQRTLNPDLASFGNFLPAAELEHNATETEGGGASGASGTAAPHEGAAQTEASGTAASNEEAEQTEDGGPWLPLWTTEDGTVAVDVKRNRCRVAVEKLEHKYNVNLTAALGGNRDSARN
jgi:hypothetical protein